MKLLGCSYADLQALPEGYVDVALAMFTRDQEQAKIARANDRHERRTR